MEISLVAKLHQKKNFHSVQDYFTNKENDKTNHKHFNTVYIINQPPLPQEQTPPIHDIIC